MDTSGPNVFYNCKDLTDVFCYAESVPFSVGDAFADLNMNSTTLHVPSTSIEAYKAVTPWKLFKEIVSLTDSDPKPTGIKAIEVSDNDQGSIYDLNGRRVEQPTKGLYIKNSKKYVVK